MDCPDGLHADLYFITKMEEAHILGFLEAQKWTRVGNREECQFGYGYVHSERKVIDLVPIPKVFMRIAKSLEHVRSPPKFPNQIIALRYIPPYDLPPHKDAHVFDNIIHTLCIGSGVVRTFHDGKRRHDIAHHPRAMVTMGGFAREACTHCILPGEKDIVDGKDVKRGVRYALTFRCVLNAHLPPDPIHIE